MEKDRIQELVGRYREGGLTAGEERELEGLIEQGLVELEELGDLGAFSEHVMRLETAAPGRGLDDRFYAMIREEKSSLKQPRASFSLKSFFTWPSLAPSFALAAVTLIVGFGIGYWSRPATPADTPDMAQLTREVTDLKEMMMLSLLEKESATDRLKAVSLTQDMDQASQKVTRALVETLNNDDNVNVRLSALEALAPYAQAPHVREALVRAIAHQDSPLVQVALAELMAGLQVKSSVKELQKILKDDRTPADIKHKIQQSIDIII